MSTRTNRARQHRAQNEALRLMRKQAPRADRRDDRVRRRDWPAAFPIEADEALDIDLPAEERIMPRGERDRRKATLLLAARLPQDEVEAPAVPSAPDGEVGLVVEVRSGHCRVELGERTLLCTLRGALSAAESGLVNLVAVGDRVRVTAGSSALGIVEEVLPRSTVLSRPDVFNSHLQQVIAANVEQLLIVSAWRAPAHWPELVDRYLVAAQRFSLAPIICLNKVDLAAARAEPEAVAQTYRALGYRVLLTSATTAEGVDELRALLHGRITALAGLSGVGKSSLLAAAEPGLQLRIGEVSERHHEGRHTTTHVSYYRLRAGGGIVDTPGIRGLGLAGLTRAELAGYLPEIAAAAGDCRYANCTHGAEPGCAVRRAVAEGRIAESRYASFRAILAELR